MTESPIDERYEIAAELAAAQAEIESLRSRLVEANTKLSLCAHHVHGSYDLLNTALLPEAVTDDVLVLSVARGAANLRSRLAEDEKLYDELSNDYVLVRNNRDEIARELGETNEALAACQSQGAGLQARLAELREAARKVTCRTCSGNGHTFIGIDPCPDCADLRRLLGESHD